MLKNLDFIWPLKLTLGSQIPSLVTGVGRDPYLLSWLFKEREELEVGPIHFQLLHLGCL